MAKEIRIEEGKLKLIFEIRDNGVVELKQFDPAGRADVRERKREAEDFYPITEVQMTGRGSRGMHAYKHNVSGGATDFTYQSHEIVENKKRKRTGDSHRDGIWRKSRVPYAIFQRCCGSAGMDGSEK